VQTLNDNDDPIAVAFTVEAKKIEKKPEKKEKKTEGNHKKEKSKPNIEKKEKMERKIFIIKPECES